MDFARSVATGASASRITWSKLSCNFGRRSSVAILSLQGLQGLQTWRTEQELGGLFKQNLSQVER